MKNFLKTHDLSIETFVEKHTVRHLNLQSLEFIEYLNGYEQWLRVLGYAASTVYYFPAYLGAFMYFLEKRDIMKIKKARSTHVRWFISSLSKKVNPQTGNTLSRNYQLNYLNALKRFSRYLTDCHGIILDCSVRTNGNSEQKRMWLTNEEIESLYSSCKDGASGDMNRAILSVFYGLGLRRSEGVALDIDDIQVPNGVVYIRKGKYSKERYVPLNGFVLTDIERYINKVREPQLNRIKQKEKRAMFISERGRRITVNAIYNLYLFTYNFFRLS